MNNFNYVLAIQSLYSYMKNLSCYTKKIIICSNDSICEYLKIERAGKSSILFCSTFNETRHFNEIDYSGNVFRWHKHKKITHYLEEMKKCICELEASIGGSLELDGSAHFCIDELTKFSKSTFNSYYPATLPITFNFSIYNGFLVVDSFTLNLILEPKKTCFFNIFLFFNFKLMLDKYNISFYKNQFSIENTLDCHVSIYEEIFFTKPLFFILEGNSNPFVASFSLLDFKNSCFPIRDDTLNVFCKLILNIFKCFCVSGDKETDFITYLMLRNKASDKDIQAILDEDNTNHFYNLYSYYSSLSAISCMDQEEEFIKFFGCDKHIYFFIYDNLSSSQVCEKILSYCKLLGVDNFLKINFNGLLTFNDYRRFSLEKRFFSSVYGYDTLNRKFSLNCKSEKKVYSILLKPSSFKSNMISLFLDTFQEILNSDIEFDRLDYWDTIPFDLFNILYPSCLDRPWGKDWYMYLTSGPCARIFFKSSKNILLIRHAALEYRKRSGILWTRNVIHCPETIEELVLFNNY